MTKATPQPTQNSAPDAPDAAGGAEVTRGSTTALRRGWTTGACATAAAKSAVHALVHGIFLDPVEIILPKGQAVSFALSTQSLGESQAMASIIKDAGDDPDITHGARIQVTASLDTSGLDADGNDIIFVAGPGVGTVTKPGLPIAVGQPSITPVPRQMITQAVRQVLPTGGVRVEISIPGGEAMAQKTMNPRLGVLGGLSILGTTGVVVPYSCASWIHSIHRGIDVARAAGITHVVGSTGATSEKLAQQRFGLSEQALLDMGDFAGGLLKYIRDFPVPRLTLSGGIGKLAKLAQGEMDLHSARSRVDVGFLANLSGNDAVKQAESAAQALMIEPALGQLVAARAAQQAQQITGDHVSVDVMVTTRQGDIVGVWEPSIR